MKKEAKILLISSLVILVAVVGGSIFYKRQQEASQPPPQTVVSRPELIRDDSHVLGPKDALVTIVEFLDPECESCKAFAPTMKAALAKYDGRVRLVARYMAFHSSSQVAIGALEAAALQGQYWEMLELLFDRAEEWGHQPSPRFDLFERYAHTLGLDVERFNKDSMDPRWPTKVSRDMADGNALGVKGTPTIFVNGVPLAGLSPDALDASIARALSPTR